MSPTTVIKQEAIPYLEYPSPNRNNPSRKQCLIFFITGNPGLAAYYTPFLTHLRQLLSELESTPTSNHAYHIYCRNLLGFSDADHSPPFGTPLPNQQSTTTLPFTLEDQIQSITTTLHSLSSPTPFHSIILIGHSVGAYIATEIFHRTHCTHLSPISTLPLTSGILLFPTLTHIALSPSGRKLNLIRTTPLLNTWTHILAKSIINLLPTPLLQTILSKFLSQPPHAASATLSFLQSQDGIWQAIHMGKDEMATITEEKWSDELWQLSRSSNSPSQSSKFYFYFAKKDHWVADEVRDAFIERRKTDARARTKAVICEEDIPHAFCIHHSETVAEKVKVWIQEITG
ncbi:hypothetical protein QBC40DRAFT_319149 [Triangularia verruculosa]|uniref:Lipid droplet-associated hydrolase n=1 Tax=Triangularia verruculosa TaxID=2587418 RepID=A0AAN6XLJ5_9PEZI|nr:hypothetical protein QBC40DRAFT_319149 [Triangularia verruculosa]